MKAATTRRAAKLAERLFALPQLLQNRRWSQKELMDYFGVDRKTIISDINRTSGRPISSFASSTTSGIGISQRRCRK